MTFFDPRDVAALRADQRLTMRDAATIARPVTADGGTATTYATTASNVPVCVRGGQSREVQLQGETRRITVTPLIFPFGTTVPEGARITVGTREFLGIGPEGLPSADHQSGVVWLTQEII